MEKLHIFGIFLFIIIGSSSLIVLNVGQYLVNQNTYGTMYTIDQSSNHNFFLNKTNVPTVYGDFEKTSMIIDNSIYTLIEQVETNNTITALMKINFNKDFMTISNQSFLSTPLPSNRSYINYEGLVYYNNAFITLEETVYYNYSNSLTVNRNCFFIVFNTTNIISNITIISNPNYWGIKNNGGYDYYFSIQEFNNRVYTLRHIDNVTASGTFSDFILSEYKLPGLNYINSYIVSSYSVTLQKNLINQISHSYITGFVIDNQGNLWFSLINDSVGNSNQEIKIKTDLNANKIERSLVCPQNGCMATDDTNFYYNITYQSAQAGYKSISLSTSTNIISWFLGIESNRYFEIITTYISGYNSGNLLLGFRISNMEEKTLMNTDLIILSTLIVLAIIGIIITYYKTNKSKTTMQVDR